MDANVSPEWSNDLKELLTQLRGELNLLNTLNCNVHRYQGDFSIDQTVAVERTTAANALYLAHLQSRVAPLFLELGKMLVSLGEVPDPGPDWPSGAEEMIVAGQARNWYRENYNTGEIW